ncbi:MAG: cobalt ECF transporter T component CbiQ [Muribaculaceae bacterium]|nr:cobalt ECF transporter T component CbiQ [Muribaculaceae bacterium]
MKLEKALILLHSNQSAREESVFTSRITSRSMLLVTILYLLFLLSLPLGRPSELIWFALYPIVMSPLISQPYQKIFINSLYILPFIILIGIFNPIYDTSEAFRIGTYKISKGWVIFFSLIIRGLLSMQALIILIKSTGFIEICNSLYKLRCPKIITCQLLMLYRYIGLFIAEGINIRRSVESRGYGKKSYSVKIWATIIGSMLIRTYERSKRIHNSMLSRGFQGFLPMGEMRNWSSLDTLFLFGWCLVFILLRSFDISSIMFSKFI